MAPKSFFLFFLALLLCNYTIKSQTIPKFTSILVFGDSTVDTGNNNYIFTLFKGNHPPYGKDYYNPIPTGRFSNGKLVPDILAFLLKLKKYGVPPYLQPNLMANDLKTGVCFASAGSGYDDLTSSISGVIPMRKQLEYFKEYLEKLKGYFEEKEAEKIVKGALVIVSSGSNDFIFNFYDIPTRRVEFNMNEYQDFLLDKLQFFVKELYELGCHKIIVSGLSPIGCLPIQMTAKSPLHRICLEKENSDSQFYNQKLEKLLPNLQSQLPGSKILYADIYTPISDLINNPQEYGFEEIKKGCCGTGLLEAGPLCTTKSPVCTDTSLYIFFDSIHPTESTYYHITEYLVKELLPKFSTVGSF
ncbi:GDSL esterase/lipase At1g58430-like [Nicotiana tabacum]|uniref:GDSL esterase/lipase At1g58430-like n=1 Tax=Nicotiana tabacum TaxID=4097 RepID=A0A1S4DN20_TOBAC|nr:PREDICTED: GDSL esterase/lipase At1g58430-like [Nicotiana tabacum]